MTYEELIKIQKRLRKLHALRVILILIFLVIGFFITIKVIAPLMGTNEIIILIPLLIGLMPSLIIENVYEKPLKNQYRKAYKERYVQKALAEKITDLTYNQELGISKDVIASTGMFNLGDKYYSNDFISGYYKNLPLVQSDIKIKELKYVRSSSGSSSRLKYVTTFEGRWFIFQFNKNFKANLQVCQRTFYQNKVQNKPNELPYQLVEMESSKFNSRFRIYAQIPHDAFYILTPHIMEKIYNLSEKTKASILLCFINNSLHVGLKSNKDTFEPPHISKKIDDTEETAKVLKEIENITMFIDELELDNDLFKTI